MSIRLSRVEQTEQNRARVLAAARKVLVRRGFHAVSVDEIAEAAGFSRGVVYSQFGGKADLVLALLEARIVERTEHYRALVADLSGMDGLRAIAAAVDADAEDNADWLLLMFEFRVHAARHPELASRYAALHQRTVTAMAEVLAGLYERAGTHPPRPVKTLAQAMLVLGVGISLERLADPQALSTVGSGGPDAFDMFAPVFEPTRRRQRRGR